MAQGYASQGNIVISGTVDTNNSTTAPLNASVTFTGTSTEVMAYASVTVNCKTDQDSTLYVDVSPNGSDWSVFKEISIFANTFANYTFNISTRYYRIRLTNISVSNQTTLILQSVLSGSSSAIQGTKLSTFSPEEGVATGSENINIDVAGNLKSRSQILTDELSFRDDFVGVALGTDWVQEVTSGSVTVATSNVTLASGTTSGGICAIDYAVDYLPLTCRGAFSVSQRIANQTIHFGFIDRTGTTINYGAFFQFDGTDNTVVKCVSQNSSSANDTETTTVTLPNAYLSSEVLFYKIDLANNQATFSVSSTGTNYVLLFQHQLHLPNPYDVLNLELSVMNSAVVTNTNIVCNVIFVNNTNRVAIDNDFNYDTLPVTLFGTTDFGQNKSLNTTLEGHLEVAIHSPRLPFGSVHTENLTPVFQADGVYGINSNLQITTVSGSGVATTVDSAFSVSSGTTVFSQGVIQSRKRLRYRAGQGIVGRFAGFYSSPVANSYQLMGFGSPEDGFYFGYGDTNDLTNTEFGILYVNRGVREVKTLTITTGATVSGNVTITLNGTAFTVAVTNSSNIQRTVWEISQGTYAGWTAYPIGATVIFLRGSAGTTAGTQTFGAGATGSAGTIVQTKAGVNSTDLFIPQSEWNGDRLDGQGGIYNSSGATLNPQNGNVYQIGIQYLGFGTISFGIEVVPTDGNNADFINVHTLKFPNTRVLTTISNPSFPFTMAVYSAGSTTNLTVRCGSYAGFIEGKKVLAGSRFSYTNTLTTVGAVNVQALFTVLNKGVYKTKTNQAVVNLMSIAGACKHTSPVIFFLIKNGSLGGNPNFSDYSTNSITAVDTSATTVSFTNNEQLIWTGYLGDTGNFDFSFISSDYNSEEITLQPNEWLTLGARATTGSPSYVSGGLNTREDT